MTDQNAENLPAGSRVSRGDEIWTAGDTTDPTRWMHQGGERQISDGTVQRWLGDGDAEVLP